MQNIPFLAYVTALYFVDLLFFFEQGGEQEGECKCDPQASYLLGYRIFFGCTFENSMVLWAEQLLSVELEASCKLTPNFPLFSEIFRLSRSSKIYPSERTATVLYDVLRM